MKSHSTRMLKHILAAVFIAATSCATLAQPAHNVAASQGAPAAGAETRALLVSVAEVAGKQQAELEAIGKVIAKWSAPERTRFFETVLRSSTNLAFEKQIASVTAEMRSLLQASQRGQIRGAEAESRAAKRLGVLAVQLRSAYEGQVDYLTRQLHAGEAAARR